MTAQNPVIDYAAWTAPESSITVVYSIPLFHEIDFVANEGYRRIPHGGLEIGGLLFGRLKSDSVQIEAFRPIDCEHSTGPSFILSARDVEKLGEQLRDAGQDPELDGLVPVGWFISHSRGDLVLSDREAALFDQLFPHRNELTVLVKPEKLQPTRFAFLVRDSRGKANRNGTQQAIILPLAGRAGRAGGADPAPSIVAPAYEAEEFPAPPAAKPSSVPLPEQKQEKPEPVQTPPPVVRQPPPIAENKPLPKMVPAAMPHAPLTGRTARLAARPTNRGVSILVSIFILLLAGGVGFAVGYFAYSRLSFSTISLTVEDHPPVLFVSWPPEDSRDADSASIRVDDGPPRPLTLQEKAGGEAEVKVRSGSVKIELLTHKWFHESRGIVRYVRPAAADNPASFTP